MLCVVVMYNLRYMFDIIMRVLYVRLLRENEIYVLSDSCGLFLVMKCFIDPVVQEAALRISSS